MAARALRVSHGYLMQEGKCSDLAERMRKESAAAQAEATQASTYLKRIVRHLYLCLLQSYTRYAALFAFAIDVLREVASEFACTAVFFQPSQWQLCLYVILQKESQAPSNRHAWVITRFPVLMPIMSLKVLVNPVTLQFPCLKALQDLSSANSISL